MNKNELSADDTYTLNGLVKVLECNRNTVEKRVKKGEVQLTTLVSNNRSYPAYIVPLEVLKKWDFEIHQNKGGVTTSLKRTNTKAVSGYTDKVINEGVSVQSSNTEGSYNSYTNETLRNVKSTEDVNALVESKLNVAELKEQLADYKVEVAKLQADKSIIETKLLLIEDKQTVIEGENSRLNQELNTLKENHLSEIREKDKQLKKSNFIILGLATIILIAMTVALTILFIR